MERTQQVRELPTDIHDISVAIWETRVKLSSNRYDYDLNLHLYSLQRVSRAVQFDTLLRKIAGGTYTMSQRKLGRLQQEADRLGRYVLNRPGM